MFKKIWSEQVNDQLKRRIWIDLYFEAFFEILQATLKGLTSYKQKTKVRHNNNPFMTKHLRKEIMVTPKLRNEFNKYKK